MRTKKLLQAQHEIFCNKEVVNKKKTFFSEIQNLT